MDENSEHSRQLDAVASAIAIIWLGIAILANMPWGWFLLGIGLIIAGDQLSRSRMRLKLQGFWIACGTVFLIGGVWQVLALTWPLTPFLIILLGIILLGRAAFGARR